jgi:LmbE family N-acetylglucosaminyl deacetylase
MAQLDGGPERAAAASLEAGGPVRKAVRMEKPLTLMAVQAHPDDESSSTGGVLARYAAQGVRTVVVTCTNGELGDGPGGLKPGEAGHDEAAVAATRIGELEVACRLLGVANLELLGYHDSGMPDWPFKERPDAFCNVPVDEAAARLAALLERYQPQVVVTHDDHGGYNHPDHVHASRITVAAVDDTGIPAKLYFTARRRSDFQRIRSTMVEAGARLPERPQVDPEQQKRMEDVERRITTTVDTTGVVGRKRAALEAHASQISESWFQRVPPELFVDVFGHESFIRARDVTGAPIPEDDLFTGVR